MIAARLKIVTEQTVRVAVVDQDGKVVKLVDVRPSLDLLGALLDVVASTAPKGSE